MKKRPHVAILVETSKIYGREVIQGINQYIRSHEPWSIFVHERALDESEPAWLATWEGDGIITRSSDKARSLAAQKRGIQVVNLRYSTENDPLYSIFCSELLIAELGVNHFTERGFHHFAYFGCAENWSDKRMNAFTRELRTRNLDCAVLRKPEQPTRSWEEEQEWIGDWLSQCPKPLAVLACNDNHGLQILDACRRKEIAVPGEIAVLGVDNDPALCDLGDPPLSSIDQNCRAIGYRAAETLDALMHQRPLAQTERKMYGEPKGVVIRRSTDIIAIDDPHVSRALHLIRQPSSHKLSIDEIATQSGTSRRNLEKKFRQQLDRSINEEINEARINKIKELLTQTDFKLSHIAELCGFDYPEYMTQLFKKQVGIPPGQYRKRHQTQA